MEKFSWYQKIFRLRYHFLEKKKRPKRPKLNVRLLGKRLEREGILEKKNDLLGEGGEEDPFIRSGSGAPQKKNRKFRQGGKGVKKPLHWIAS